MTTYDGFLRCFSRSRDTIEAAVADNCRFDERAGADRWQRFEDLLSELVADRGAVGWQDWTEANRLHLDRYCNVPRPCVPDAFLEVNRSAWLDGLSENQTLIRIEALNRPLQNSDLDLDGLKDLFQRADGGDDDARRAVRSFFDAWNQGRDARPAFAAFYGDVQQESGEDDWPHALRDRLGLGHYGHAGGAPLPVALMRYPPSDVYSAHARQQQPSRACALPTVLDGGMHQFFFPVPRERSCGATVHLQPGPADTLTAEIVHCRIDYRREHLYRLGTITRPHQLNDSQLRKARDLHLLALQKMCSRGNFGETFEGRT